MKRDHLYLSSESDARNWPANIALIVYVMLLLGVIAWVWVSIQSSSHRETDIVTGQHDRPTPDVVGLLLANGDNSEPHISASLVANPVALNAHSAVQLVDIQSPTSPWLNAMAVSNDRPQDLVLKAIAGHGDKSLKELYLLSAFSHLPQDLLVNFHLLALCIEDPSASVCSLPFEKILLARDGQNVYTLIYLALYHAAMGDYQKAQEFLTLAAWGEVQEDYVLRHLIAVDESYRYHEIPRTVNALDENLELAVTATVPNYRQLSDLCDALAASRGAEGQVLCQLMGKQLQQQSKSLLDQATGGVFKLRYAGVPEAQSTQSIEVLQSHARQDHQALAELNFLFERYSNSQVSDLVWAQFLSEYKSHDEVTASLYLVDYFNSNLAIFASVR